MYYKSIITIEFSNYACSSHNNFMENYFMKLDKKELLKDQVIDITQAIYATISAYR